jgi:cyclohexanone monooxygenase
MVSKSDSGKHDVARNTTELDVAIIGAGCAGLYAIHHFLQTGLTARVYESGEGVGGTWYWNRYPGARVDIESMEYSLAFSDVVQQEWEWSERYASQPELLRYFNFVVDRLDLRKNIQFNTRVESAIFDENSNRWLLETNTGERVSARHCVMTTGFLSAPNKPKFKGMDTFEGKIYHTAEWPHAGVDLTGQRVGIVGTGSSAVQITPIIAEQVAHLHVFQRTATFAVPLRNHPMPPEYQKRVKAEYGQWRYKERYGSFGGWVALNYEPVELTTSSALDVSAEERRAYYEARWKNGGLAFYNVYPDVYSDKKANDTLADFLREKIRERINDPAVAELMMPSIPVLTKRLIADNGYYEAFNRDNVTLVDIKNKPIEEITPKGIKVGDTEYEFDCIIFATGFDALTGALTRMNIRGRNGVALKEHWQGGARTHLGLMSAGFPNMYIIAAAGSPAPLFQPMLLCEEQIDWVGDCIKFLDKYSFAAIEPTSEAENNWGRMCTEAVEATLFPMTDSWYVGANVPGKSSVGLSYFGGIGNYRKYCAEAAASGYSDFVLTSPISGAEEAMSSHVDAASMEPAVAINA